MTLQHERTLKALFAHPLTHGLTLRDVQGLIESLGGAVSPLADRRVHIRLADGSQTWLHGLQGPGASTLDAEAVMRLRHLLQAAGLDPQHHEVPGPASPRGDQARRLVLKLSHRHCEAFELDGDRVVHSQLRSDGLWDTRQSTTHRKERDLPGQRAPIDSALLERLCGLIAGADRVLLVGHGTGQSDLRQLLLQHLERRHPALTDRVEAVLTVNDDQLTEARLLALAQEHFGNVPRRHQPPVQGA
ncbi:MAG: hypothetical protein ACKOCM_06045 [Cyanobacteriota bacterium]